ncbi:MAG: (E)-4-hydroxy-3-methylbut-2-enyl-diphosphate synthase [Deltaproteobacteria bacterium]|nr:(E)-4-hydroxy-3-methylbut-2-enyl-diphosphate synthase [Deltaproteobacteria bacterium]
MLLSRQTTYRRRSARTVWVGQIAVGGNYPIRVQSMTTSDTKDTASLIPEIERLVEAGCEIVRVTVPTQADCDNLPNIRTELKKRKIKVPLAADIHFTPSIAMQVVPYVEKVRINPGNFVDKKLFKTFEYTDAQYAEELTRIREKFVPLVLKCKEYDVAMRIGANHGSLSDRIMNRYGDTPEGMVESALEFVRICEELDYRNLVLSMKASNVQVMTAAYRLLDERMKKEGMNYPFHLGVTEAGFGDEGRIKSAIGIGALLEDGIGDTIRVSLTEDAVNEVPVAYQLVQKYNALHIHTINHQPSTINHQPSFSASLEYRRRPTKRIMIGGVAHGGNEPVRVWVSVPLSQIKKFAEEYETWRRSPEGKNLPLEGVEVIDDGSGEKIPSFSEIPVIFETENPLLSADSSGGDPSAPVMLRYCPGPLDDPLLSPAVIFGSLLLDGIGDAICLPAANSSLSETMKLAYNILQGARLRISKTEYIACPSCGRTQFDLQSTTRKIQEITSHLKGVKIAVMGCIVNGPGEMADADFGYVGTGQKKISLYVGKECVERNIPEESAVSRLVSLIKVHNRWVEIV